VESLPLGQIVRSVIRTSHNYAAETLFRHIGRINGGDGTWFSAKETMTVQLKSLGLWSDNMLVSDGSGLSLSNYATACVLASAVLRVYEDPNLHDILWGLPVAGVDGTLRTRFDDPDEANGRGVVRAKTGTHDDVRTLTGYAQDSSGAVTVFSFLLNDLYSTTAGTDWLDEAAAVLAS
jgi:D-alanyl-D-alanine carboxypeptidase/D-alanyl-D-alanine-endopeptidase (penicillin-binding protein 4)